MLYIRSCENPAEGDTTSRKGNDGTVVQSVSEFYKVYFMIWIGISDKAFQVLGEIGDRKDSVADMAGPDMAGSYFPGVGC